MAQHSFNHMGGGGAVDPNDLAYGSSFQNNFGSSHTNGFSGGSGGFQDDELLESLGTPTEQTHGLHGQDFGTMDGLSVPQYAQGIYSPATQSIPLDQNHINGYSNTPEGDPIQSPFVHNFSQYRQMQNPQAFGSMHSPSSFTNTDRATRMPTAMQRKISNTRSPLTPGSAPRPGMPLSSESFGAQPIRTNGSHHEKTNSGQWIQTPNSVSSFPGSGLSSPMQGMHSAQHLDFLMKNGGASLPAKIGTNMTPSQEAKRKRRRESHNLVERRRRDNINERIQDLSKLVPAHRLEDEKMKKLITTGTPLSPTLTGISSPSQATSTLAGPGAKRATGGTAGNITTGLPIEDKDKGPNKGDILNGAVSWTRDLMWLLNVHISRQEELLEWFSDRGEPAPFTITNDERRMTSELINALRMPDLTESEKKLFVYSRTNGTGLRVPDHTDYKGDPLEGTGVEPASSVSPDAVNEFVDQGQFEQNPHWDYDNDSGELDIREEDEFMDLN